MSLITSTLRKLLSTPTDTTALISRVTLGAVMLPHGLQKTLGWFGGFGFEGTMNFFTHSMGIPWMLAFAAIATEAVGSLALITGTLGRFAALAIATNMAVAIATVHWHNGFFMNWLGSQHGEGFEYHILAIGLAATVVLRGSGALSVDRWLAATIPWAAHRAPPTAQVTA
jgi:putative oxidoreductase